MIHFVMYRKLNLLLLDFDCRIDCFKQIVYFLYLDVLLTSSSESLRESRVLAPSSSELLTSADLEVDARELDSVLC